MQKESLPVIEIKSKIIKCIVCQSSRSWYLLVETTKEDYDSTKKMEQFTEMLYEYKQDLLANSPGLNEIFFIFFPGDKFDTEILLNSNADNLYKNDNDNNDDNIDELVKLNKASFVEKDDYVVVKVKDAKGKKDREVYMSYKYYKYVKAYMSTHSNPALFVSQRGTRISERQAGVVINSISDVIGKELTPHDYRASCLTYMYEQGVDINTIADIAGHENIQTTRGYIQANEKETSKRALSAF